MHKIHHHIKGLGELWGVKVVLLAIVFCSGVFSGRYVFPVSTANAQDVNYTMGTVKLELPKEMQLYQDVKKILDDKFIRAGEVKEQDKAYGSIKGLVESYGDPFTSFFPPTQAKEFKTAVSGSFSGVGMEVGVKDGYIVVIAPLKKSPAEKAGMKPDDKILKINGTTTEAMTTETAVSLIRGEKGTPVTLTVSRKGEDKTRDITIIRDKIELPIIETQNMKDAFVISIYSFTETSPQKFQEALQEFAKSNKKNLVLDLRNNPGGYLEAAVLMGSFFFPADKVIVSEDFTRTGKKNDHKSKGFNAIPSDIKMIILINKGSASASEILAGAFQDYKRAKIVGEKSFGKGSVQEYIELPTGESLKVTVARWLTPDGQNISKDGIHPDILLNMNDVKVKGKKDVQLENAVSIFSKWSEYKDYSARSNNVFDFEKKQLVPSAATASSTSGVQVQVKQ